MNTQTSTRPTQAITYAQQLLHAASRSGEWRERVYAEIVQLNRFIHEGEERLVITTAEEPRNQTRALVTQLISARVDLERALAGPSVDDWNPTALSGKVPHSTTKLAATSSSSSAIVILVVGIGTIVAVLACAIAGALGLFGVLNVTGIPTVIDMPNGIEIPGIGQSQATVVVVATFEPPAVLGSASITLPGPDAPPPSDDASRDLMGVMPSPVPVVNVPTVQQPTVAVVEPPPTVLPPTQVPATEVPATEVPATAVTETPTPDPTPATPMP